MGWQAELFGAGSPEPGAAGWRVPSGSRAHAENRDRPAAAAGPGLGAGPRPLAPPGGGRPGGGGRSRLSAREGVVRAARRARASAARDGLSRAGRRAESHGPGPGSEHRLARSQRTASDRLPRQGDVRRPEEGRRPLAQLFPILCSPKPFPGQGRGRGGEAGDKPAARAGPGRCQVGARGSSGARPDSRDGGFLAPVPAAGRCRPGCAPHFLFSFLHCSSFFLLSHFPRRITWSANLGEARGQRPGQPPGRSSPPFPSLDGVRFPPHTRACSEFSGRSESPGVLPAVMRKSSEPSRPPGRGGRSENHSDGSGNAWRATRAAGILPS